MTRIPGALVLFLLTVSGSRPQQIGQNKGAGETQSFTLTVQSNLVVEAVEVKDKQGNFIHGLTAKDFVLTEDGAPQTIRYCEHEDLAATAQPRRHRRTKMSRFTTAWRTRRSHRNRSRTNATRTAASWRSIST
jgi:hypothetical protein